MRRHKVIAGVSGLLAGVAALAPVSCAATPTGIHKIKHIVMIMQENRSFDSYFGTYPGADGIPMRAGVPTVCVPDPAHGGCQRPFHDHTVVNNGGPHSAANAVGDIAGGEMNGFVDQIEKAKG